MNPINYYLTTIGDVFELLSVMFLPLKIGIKPYSIKGLRGLLETPHSNTLIERVYKTLSLLRERVL
jgi:hypothetical protein